MVMSASTKVPSLLLTLLVGSAILTACGGGQESGPNDTLNSASAAELAPFEVNEAQDLLDATALAQPDQPISDNGSAAAPTLEQCAKLPAVGTVQTYLNTNRTKREWKSSTFEGETVVARFDYPTLSATKPSRILYYKVDDTARTRTFVAQEFFDSNLGTLITREQYLGRTSSTALPRGKTETINYTVKTLYPAGVADRVERLRRTYENDKVVTLRGGRLITCSVKEVNSRVIGSTVTPISTETLQYAAGLGWVKDYYTPTQATAPDRNMTYLAELDTSTAPISYLPDTAGSKPTLGQCSRLAIPQNLVYSGNDAKMANSVQRSFSVGTFQGSASLMMRRADVNGVGTMRRYYDPNVGYLRHTGDENLDSAGNILQSTVISNIPDLRNAVLGQSLSYSVLSKNPAVASDAGLVRSERFTLLGHQRVTTPAGTFDTCRVRFDYLSNNTSEIMNLTPTLSWVRVEMIDGSTGKSTLRELMKR